MATAIRLTDLTWPENWSQILMVVTTFAAVGLVVGLLSAQRQLRRLD